MDVVAPYVWHKNFEDFMAGKVPKEDFTHFKPPPGQTVSRFISDGLIERNHPDNKIEVGLDVIINKCFDITLENVDIESLSGNANQVLGFLCDLDKTLVYPRTLVYKNFKLM